VVFAAMVGMSFTSLAPAAVGLFIEPLSHEFGWKRATISLGLSIYALFAVPFSPLAGALVDRRGSRQIAIPGLAITACAFAAFSLANGSVSQWIGLWFLYAFLALSIKTTLWTAAVSSLFTTSRGLALAVTFCGTAITQTLCPLLTRWLIDDYGWRNAYLWLGFGWGGLTLLIVVFFLVDARDRGNGKRTQDSAAIQIRPVLAGLSFKDAMRSPSLRRVAAATLLITLLTGALLIHQVPILTGKGLSRETAALLAATSGFASLFGKLCTGWLFDRSRSGWIGGISLSLPAVACALLLQPASSFALIVCAMLCMGYAAGASLQLCSYLTSRYAGIRHFGKVYGVMASLMALGTGIGPVVGGMVFDHFGSYTALLAGGIPVSLLCGLLVTQLGAYPQFSDSESLQPEAQ
jgi:predicted MFS family arabinose efflux permease